MTTRPPLHRALVCALAVLVAACSSPHRNGAPTAAAAAAATTSFGEQVQLDASASADPEGGALTYEWTQLAGPAVTLTGSVVPTFTAPAEAATLQFRLVVVDAQGARSAPVEVRVNVLRNGEKAFFVAKGGDDAGPGTPEAPLLTIGAGISAAAAAGPGAGVYVAEGRYDESLQVPTDVAIYGGYAAAWIRTPATTPTIVAGGATAASVSAAERVVLDGLELHSADATLAGESSIGLRVYDASDVTVHGCRILAGAGGAGSPGAEGAPGPDAAPGSPGVNGGVASPLPFCNSGTGRLGGAGGIGPQGGGAGGTSGCFAGEGLPGSPGTGAGGGAGGVPGGSPAGAGQAGAAGAPGMPGLAGREIGGLGGGAYHPAPGGDGGPGSAGAGGGGGAGGNGSMYYFGPQTVWSEAGGGGGGGGASGLGGGGGSGGSGGGGSFGLVVASSSGVILTDVEIVTGTGGTGGAGGEGGLSPGGAGGAGGAGPRGTSVNIGFGGPGGAGGDGGRGGAGGGGGGGPSVCILRDASSSLTSSGLLMTPGAGGAGGASTGLPGATGASDIVRIDDRR